jgi:hypothetical protein
MRSAATTIRSAAGPVLRAAGALALLLQAAGLAAQANPPPAEAAGAPRACTLFAPAADPASASLLDIYNTQARLIRSLRLVVLVQGHAGSEYRIGAAQRELPVLLEYARPGQLRVTGVVPMMGKRGFDLASDGREFRMLIPEKNRETFLVGAVDAPANSPNPRENLRPQPLIDALDWPPATALAGSAASQSPTPGRRAIEVDLAPGTAAPRRAKIVFDLAQGVIQSVETFDAFAHALYKADYSDWKVAPGASGSAHEGCFPRHIQLVENAENFEIRMRISQITLNPEIPRERFRLLPPRGVPVVHAGKRSR